MSARVGCAEDWKIITGFNDNCYEEIEDFLGQCLLLLPWILALHLRTVIEALAPVVQRADNFVHWIGSYTADKMCVRISL